MRILRSLLIATLLAVPAQAATLQEDVDVYVAIFQGNPAQHAPALEQLGSMGLSDPRLFDLIERQLLAQLDAPKGVKMNKKLVVLQVRALGYSGLAKYVSTIQRVAEIGGDRGEHANLALKELELYRKWNPLISDRAGFQAGLEDEVNRTLNMLRSTDLGLNGLAARLVFAGRKDDVLLDALAVRLRATYPNSKELDSATDVQAIAWIVKAIDSARQARFKPLFAEILLAEDVHNTVLKWTRAAHSHLNK